MISECAEFPHCLQALVEMILKMENGGVGFDDLQNTGKGNAAFKVLPVAFDVSYISDGFGRWIGRHANIWLLDRASEAAA